MRFPRIKLQAKLALVTLLLLAVPFVGFRYAAMMTSFLLSGQEQALALTARAVTTSLNDRPELFHRNILQSLDASREIHAYSMVSPVQLDGDFRDWGALLEEMVFYDRDDVLSGAAEEPGTLRFGHVSGRYDEFIYVLLQVTDDQVVYRQKDSLHLERSDHLQIALEGPEGGLNRYLVSPIAPGWLTAHLMPEDINNFVPVKNETRIHGAWQQTVDGYTVEMRIPLNLMGNRLAFAVADVDDPLGRDLKMVIGTGPSGQLEDMGVLMASSPELERLLKALERPAVKIWVVDRIKRVRARVGCLAGAEKKETLVELLRGWLQRFLRRDLFVSGEPIDLADGGNYLEEFDLGIIDEALNGRAVTARRPLVGGDSEIVVAVEPLYGGDKVLGVVVVEQTTDNIMVKKQKIIEDTIAFIVVVVLVGVVVNCAFVTMISQRIMRLSKEAAAAIGSDGRIRKAIVPATSADEIGDLSRTLAGMLSRLEGFHCYQEKMADNLEHELRTPLAGISASLVNLRRELADRGEVPGEYLAGALDNVRRIESILARIRDATVLEEALRHDEVEEFDLVKALEVWHSQGYGPAFPDRCFALQLPDEAVLLRADPGRIHQMFDKLVENAVDFSPHGSEIVLGLERGKKFARLRVVNEGEELGPEDGERIFNSMVSLRKGGEGPHMGLGLYIVRTVAAFHGGTAWADNREDGICGVALTVELPLA